MSVPEQKLWHRPTKFGHTNNSFHILYTFLIDYYLKVQALKLESPYIKQERRTE